MLLTQSLLTVDKKFKQFVLYIRKRDPRYLPNFQSEEERVAAAREASKDQSRRARMENAAKLANYQEAEWSKTKDNWKGHETDEDDDDEEEPAVEFECVACNKTFKTEKQMEMHEKSKKHIKMVQTIKRQMRKDGVEFGLEEELSTPRAEESPKESEEEEEMVDDVSKVADKTEVGSEDESDEALIKNVDNLHIPEKETRETQEKQEKQDSDDVDDNDASDNDAKEAPQKTKGAKKARRKAKQTKAQEEEVYYPVNSIIQYLYLLIWTLIESLQSHAGYATKALTPELSYSNISETRTMLLLCRRRRRIKDREP